MLTESLYHTDHINNMNPKYEKDGSAGNFKTCKNRAHPSWFNNLNYISTIQLQVFATLLVISTIVRALPVDDSPEEKSVEKSDEKSDGIVHDEAKEIKYEDLRDHDLAESVNAGQSGWALELISHGGKPTEIWGQPRPKRQGSTKVEPMMDHLLAPEAAPIDPAYAERLSGSAIHLANQLAGAQRQQIHRVTGYGRKRRQAPSGDEKKQTLPQDEPAPIVNEEYAERLSGSAIYLANQLAGAQRQQINRVTGYGRKRRQAPSGDENEQILPEVEAAPIVNEEYAERLSGSAIYLANQLAGAQRQQINRVTGYGRRKRQTTADDEAIMSQIFEIQDTVNEIERTKSAVVQVAPKIKSWGETGLRSPLKQSV